MWLLFFVTGSCGLIFEVVWTRLLRLVMGNTTYTITTVLAAFMGGMALGSYVERHRRVDLAFLTGKEPQTLAKARGEALRCNAARGHVFLGTALANQSRYDEAAAEYRKAVAINRDDVELRYTLEVFLGKAARAAAENDLDAAGKLTGYICRIDPEYAEAQNQLGQVFVGKGLWRSAFDQFAKAVRTSPDDLTYRLRLAGMAMKLNRFPATIEHYAMALELDENCVVAASNPAYVLACSPDAAHRDAPRAVELAERAVKLTKRKDTRILNTLGAAYANVGRFDDALTVTRNALELADRAGDYELAETTRRRKELYIAHKPYRHDARTAPKRTRAQ